MPEVRGASQVEGDATLRSRTKTDSPTVKVSTETKARLDAARHTEKGDVSYDAIVNWLLDQAEGRPS